MELLFFISFFIIIYTYIGYVGVVFLLAKFFPKSHRQDIKYEPNITIMVPVKNEEFTIREKIENCFEINYPKEKLQILIVDSSSDDTTQEIVREYKKMWVELAIVPHKWKAFAMQEWINTFATGEIVISTDANAYFYPDAIRQAIKHFADRNIAGVTGWMMQIDKSNTSESKWWSLYWKMEKLLRISESKYHSCISMSGEMTCVRKEVAKNQQWYYQGDPDDFDLTLFLIRKGYRVLYEPNATVWEKAPDTADDLEKQKLRIIVQTISAFTHNYKNLFINRYGFILISHKLFPLLSPIFLLLLFISNWLLIWENIFFLWFFILQLIVYISYILKFRFSVFWVSYFIIFLNFIVLKSYFVYLSGKDFTKWDKIMSSRK